MTERALLDTGPLVALFRKDEQHHQACREAVRTIRGPLVTCWPVLTEAVWLLRQHPEAVQQLLSLCADGVFEVVPLDRQACPWVASFLARYRQLRPDLADAALAWLAERHDIDSVFTLDRRDFSVYRRQDGRPFRLLPD